jgi:ABC-type multidrug transport system ATPase subunit
MTGEPVIRVTGLTKRYGEVQALAGVDLEVRYGEVFALLGPNGAGKTTFVEILEGFRSRTAGMVDVLGYDPADDDIEMRKRIGIVLQEAGIEPELTVTEAVDYYGGFFPRHRPAEEVIESVGLIEKRGAKIKTLSGGQRRRLDLALVLVGDPDLLFLDEPTTGFDPSARRSSWSLIEGLRSLGKTILLTTHYMDEAQNLADRVAVLVDGRIVAEGPPDTLAGRDAGQAVIRFRVPEGTRGEDLAGVVDGLLVADGTVTISSPEPTRDLHNITRWALGRNLELPGLTVTRPSLEDVYLELAGRGSEDDKT